MRQGSHCSVIYAQSIHTYLYIHITTYLYILNAYLIFYSRAPGSPDWSSEKRVCVTVTSDQAGNCVTMNGAVNNGRCSGNGVTGSLYTLQLSSYPAFRHRDPGPDSGAAVWCRQSSPSCSVSNRNIKTAKQAKICCTIFCSTQYFAAVAANKQSIHSFELIHIDYSR